MRKKFLTNLFFLLFLNLLVKPFWVLGIDRSVQNAVGSADFGFYFSILNFSFLFNILLDLGITNFNNRNIAQNSQLLNKHFSGILAVKILLGILYAAVTFTVGWMIGYDAAQFRILAWVVLNQFLLSFVLYLRSNISGLLLFKTDSVLSVLDRLLMILFCSILLWGNVTDQPFRIEWFVYAQSLAYSLTFLTALIIVIRKSSFRKLNWNPAFILMVLRKSAPFALLVLQMVLYTRNDPVFIERLLSGVRGKEQAGIYAQAFRLLDAVYMIAFLFSVLLLPLFSSMIKKNQPVEELVKLAGLTLFVATSVISVMTWFHSGYLIRLLYPQAPGEDVIMFQERTAQAGFILRLLMTALVAQSSVYVFGTLLTANGNLKLLNMIAGGGVIISFTLNILLIPIYGATGAAITYLTVQSVTAILQLWFAVRIFRFRINKPLIFRILAFIAALAFTGVLIKKVPAGEGVQILIFSGFATILVFLMRMLNFRELLLVIREGDKV